MQPTSQIKYLRVTLEDDLNWTAYLVDLKRKLNHRIRLLSKIRHLLPKHLLRTLYYSLFNSHLIYACKIWGEIQTNQLSKRLLLFQEKSFGLIYFQSQISPSINRFKEKKDS